MWAGLPAGRRARSMSTCRCSTPAGVYGHAGSADDGRSAAEPTRYTISTQRVTSATRLQIPVAPGGGFALKIEPADNK